MSAPNFHVKRTTLQEGIHDSLKLEETPRNQRKIAEEVMEKYYQIGEFTVYDLSREWCTRFVCSLVCLFCTTHWVNKNGAIVKSRSVHVSVCTQTSQCLSLLAWNALNHALIIVSKPRHCLEATQQVILLTGATVRTSHTTIIKHQTSCADSVCQLVKFNTVMRR